MLHVERGLVAQLDDRRRALAGQERGDLDLERGDLLPPRLLVDQQLLGLADIAYAQLAKNVGDPRRRHAEPFLGADPALAAERPFPVAGLVVAPGRHRQRAAFFGEKAEVRRQTEQ